MTTGIGSSTFVANTGIGTVARYGAESSGAPLLDIARAAATTDGPLAATVKDLSAQLGRALGSTGDRVGSARLETAMLDFAREAKALRIGVPETAGSAIDAALAAGAAKSGLLPDVGLGALDHAVTIFTEAARTLAETPAAPLYTFNER